MRETIQMSQLEAAHLHSVPVDTITKWERGKRGAPPGVFRELQDLQRRIEEATEDLRERIEQAAMARIKHTLIGGTSPPGPGPSPAQEPVPVAIPETPQDAYSAGFPSHQSMMRAIGNAVVKLKPETAVEFVRMSDTGGVTSIVLQAPAVAN